MTTALVTGGAGFIGTNLCLELKKRGYEVRCLDNNNLHNLHFFEENDIEFLNWDVLDQPRMINACKDVDVVFHLATMCLPYSLEKDPRYTLDVCTKGTYNTFNATHAWNNKAFFVYVSSSEVYGRGNIPMEEDQNHCPSTIYGAAKAAGEEVTVAYAQLHTLPYLIIRPFNCYGPLAREDMWAAIITRMLKTLLNGGEVKIYGDGKQTRDFNYVEDTVDGIITAYEGRERLKLVPIVNISSGVETSLNDLWKTCVDTLHSSGPEFEAFQCHCETAKLVYGPPRLGDIMHIMGSTWYARQMLGWQSKFTLQQGIKKYAKWMVEKHEHA